MIIPALYGHVGLEFSGAVFEHNPFTTFGIRNNLDLSAAAVAALIELPAEDLTIAMVHSSVSLIGIHVKLGPNDTGPQASLAVNVPGTVGGSIGQANTAYLAEKQTGLGGREGRGRMFIPGVSTSVVSASGALQSANIAGFNTALDTFLDALTAADIPMYLLHSSGTVPTAVSGLVIDPEAATQRRRMR